MIRDFFQDLRVGARRLRRHRSHTITTLAALGLGLGATTAIFSVISGVMLMSGVGNEALNVYHTPLRGEVKSFHFVTQSWDGTSICPIPILPAAEA